MHDSSKKLSERIVIHVFLVFFSLLMAVPFIWMILTAFKTQTEATSIDPFIIFPSALRWDAFKRVTELLPFGRLYLNTLVLIVLRILFALVTASMVGFALGRLKFRGRGFAYATIIGQMMVPGQVFVIPQYLMLSHLNLTNTMFALLFPGLVTAFGSFLLTQAYRHLPRELEEAARIDGCSIGQTFIYVMAPLTRSALVALGIFTAVFAYKDLMWPLIVITEKSKLTLAPALANLQGAVSTHYPELMAASLIASVPMLLIYIVFQRQFIEGIASSGSKL
ncbi:MAG: carbohydrate ABC transporter permease [Eubacteriales bacterium]|nr:carbohydrate ABC transporter permease [Eubacteriales bacterium]